MEYNPRKLAIAVLLLIGPTLCPARSLRSKDGAFSVELPADWTAKSDLKAQSVLFARSEAGLLRVERLSQPLSRQLLASKFKADLDELKRKQARIEGKASQAKLPGGGVFYFVHFALKGKDFRTGYLKIGDGAYSFLARGMPEDDFQSVLDSLMSKAPGAEPLLVRTARWELEFPLPEGFEAADPGKHKAALDFYLEGPGKASLSLARMSLQAATDLQAAQAATLKLARPFCERIDPDCRVQSVPASRLANGWPSAVVESRYTKDGRERNILYVAFSTAASGGAPILLGIGTDFEAAKTLRFFGLGKAAVPARTPPGAKIGRSIDGKLAFPVPAGYQVSEKLRGAMDFALLKEPLAMLNFVSAGDWPDLQKAMPELLAATEAQAAANAPKDGLDCQAPREREAPLNNGWKGMLAEISCSKKGGGSMLETFVFFTPAAGKAGSLYLGAGINVKTAEVLDFLGRGTPAPSGVPR